MGKFGVHVHENKLNSSQHHNKSELEGTQRARKHMVMSRTCENSTMESITSYANQKLVKEEV